MWKVWNKINIDDSDLTKAVVEEARRHPGREKEVVEFYKSNPAMMSNLRGIALKEKVMGFIINSCTKKNKDCTMDDLFKSNFLKEEKETISKNKKEKKKWARWFQWWLNKQIEEKGLMTSILDF